MVEVRNINGSSHVLSLSFLPLLRVYIAYPSLFFVRALLLSTFRSPPAVRPTPSSFSFSRVVPSQPVGLSTARTVALAQSTNGVMQRGWPRGERGGRTHHRLPTSGKLNQAKRCLTRWGYTRPCYLLQPLPPSFQPRDAPYPRFPFRSENLHLQPSPTE